MTEYRRLRPNLERVELRRGQALYAAGDRVRYVYFPNDAVVSLLFAVDERRTIELAMEGNEAAVGIATYLGGVSSFPLYVVRDAGTAMRCDVNALTRVTKQPGRLQELLRRYVHALVTQVAQSDICNRFHSIDVRLVRWLLMSRDRASSNELSATHESIARLLGVRRSSITAAASDLHRQSTIDYSRGRIVILDQRGLRAASCSCYGLITRQYDSFLDGRNEGSGIAGASRLSQRSAAAVQGTRVAITNRPR